MTEIAPVGCKSQKQQPHRALRLRLRHSEGRHAAL